MVKDDETNTDIAAPAYPAQGLVGLYALGEKIGSGYSRFVTNTSGAPEIATWGVGSSVPGKFLRKPERKSLFQHRPYNQRNCQHILGLPGGNLEAGHLRQILRCNVN